MCCEELSTATIDSTLDNIPQVDSKTTIEDCAEIEGVDVGTNAEVQGNMVFLNEACLAGLVKTDRSWWNFFRLPKAPEVHVSPFLSRPVRLTSGTMVAAPAVNYSVSLDTALLQTAGGIVAYANKLKGYAGIRCTWCFRVNVSTTPFVAGRFRLTHLPGVGNAGMGAIEPIARATSRQWPGVELDVNAQTAGIIKIPHRHITPFFRLFDTETTHNNGSFMLRSYQGPSFIAPSVAPDYEVWFWIEDVEIAGIKADKADTSIVVPASGNSKVKTTGGEIPKGGPISGFLSGAAKLASWGGTMIPAISVYTTPLSWVARVGARVASALGYSRPINQAVPREVKQKEWGYNANCTGVASAYNTGLNHDTQVATAPYFGDNEDPMSFAFLNSQMHYMGNVSLALQSSGQLLMKGQLNPHALYTSPDAKFITTFERSTLFVTPFPAVFPSPAMGVAQFFDSWRGGFKIRLIFGKTKFHTGRLMFGWDYNPHVLGTAVADTCFVPSYDATAYNNRTIIDLREGNEFEIDIPYWHVAPFVGSTTSIGSWYVYVVDPLKYAGTVSPTVNVIVEAAMSEDSTWAAPRDTGYIADDTFSNVVAASGDSKVSTSKPVDLLAVTFGEDVSSLKQLAMRPHRKVLGPTGFWWSLSTARAAGVFTFPTNYGPLDWMRRIYGAEKGSLNHILIPTTDANFAGYHGCTFVNNTVLTNRYTDSGTPIFYGKNSEFHSHAVQRYSPLGVTYNVIGSAPVIDDNSPSSELYYTNIRGSETNTPYYSAADDFGCTLFKGTVPIVPRALSSYKNY